MSPPTPRYRIIIWLEEFLTKYRGAVVIVSHDKMFLDNTSNRTIEIVAGRIYDYKKPYSAYLLLREEIMTQQRAAQKNQAKEIEQTEKLIERFRAKASKAAMAQSLIKKLDKIENRSRCRRQCSNEIKVSSCSTTGKSGSSCKEYIQKLWP